MPHDSIGEWMGYVDKERLSKGLKSRETVIPFTLTYILTPERERRMNQTLTWHMSQDMDMSEVS